MNITCTVCPLGCCIRVSGEDGIIGRMEGNACKRGEAYAKEEFISPVRILTSTAKVEGGRFPLVPLRSNKPVPKARLLDCMGEIRRLCLKAPVCSHEVLIRNILGTGTDIVATGSVETSE